jgi:hypothetical protein
MLNAAPQVRVDVHLGKLSQRGFIPGPVGKKFAGNSLLRNEALSAHSRKVSGLMGINPAHGS